MTFTSSLFLIGLFPWFIFLYKFFCIKNIKSRIVLILLANIFFYIFGGLGSFAFLLIYSIIIYLLEILISKTYKRLFLIISIIISVLPLMCTKYMFFIINNINSISGSNIVMSTIIVPLGISFFTFEAVSLLVDVFNKKVEKVNFLYTYMYLSFFVTITSGPIIRFDDFKKSLNNPLLCKYDNFEAIERIIIGLSKKLLIADKIAALANYYFNGVAAGNSYPTFALWLGSIAYTLQLYFDFSGYSDMAIGIGALLGFNINENFNKPYQASTISEFWKRWHISLTEWFRNYIYIPLGGNRCKIIRHLFNMFVVWLITGIWHGANWTFIVWGIGYFILLAIEKYTKLTKKIKSTFVGHIYTLFFVNIFWVIFRSDNLNAAWLFLKGMFESKNGLIDDKSLRFLPFIVFSIILCFPWDKWLNKYLNKKFFKIVKGCILIILVIMSLCAIVNSTYAPYIYGNF